MPPYLRSVVAQVYRKSLSIGSLRNFSSCPVCKNEVKEAASKSFNQPLASYGTSLVFGFSVYCSLQIYNYWSEYPTIKNILEEQKVRMQRYHQMQSEVGPLPWGSNSLVKK